MEIPWPHPTTLEPIRPQTKISWLNVVYLGNGNQSEPGASPGGGGGRGIGINQKPTPNPSTEGNQLDVSQPRNSHFSNFSRENTLYKQCNPELGAPPYSRCVGIRWEPQLELGNKNSLAFASDIGSLVVTGRFHNLGITWISIINTIYPLSLCDWLMSTHRMRALLSFIMSSWLNELSLLAVLTWVLPWLTHDPWSTQVALTFASPFPIHWLAPS